MFLQGVRSTELEIESICSAFTPHPGESLFIIYQNDILGYYKVVLGISEILLEQERNFDKVPLLLLTNNFMFPSLCDR